MNFENWFPTQHASISLSAAASVLKLVAEEATVPFIARYRKEQTGGLDEVDIQKVIDAKDSWDLILKRQAYIVAEIERQGKLTPELKDKITATWQLELLEDLYLPYKQKRKSKATLAREAGMQGLADWIWDCGHGVVQPEPGQTLEIWAFTFRNEEKGFNDAQAAIDGATDILIERLSEDPNLRQTVRAAVMERGSLRTGKAEKAKVNSKFENYFSYHEKIESLLKPENSHRYLAVRRGWIEEELTLAVGSATPLSKPGTPADAAVVEEDFDGPLIKLFEATACSVMESPGTQVLQKASRLAYKAHVFPSIENEAHKALKKIADETAIVVFGENVKKLLLASPFGPRSVLGVDPGIRTGCKVAVVDESGKYIGSTVIHLQTEEQKSNARILLTEVVKTGNISAIAVGNGTAGRETESFIRKALKEAELSAPVVMVSEAGASVYSASEAAREEFPDLDLTVRGAISIARRLQDPLAELIKTDAKSIGVGQYQHDVSQPALKRHLDVIVDACVNSVGVNLNTASYHLLSHVAGIGEGLAKAIVEHRGAKGLFKSREELLEVPRFSKRAFEQGAGFIRIPNSENALDNTGVHPERYPLLETLATRLGKNVKDLLGSGVELIRKDKAFEQEVGSFTFKDIVDELEKPGRDPREEFVPFSFRDDIHEVKDLKPEMICPGIVTNVTNFGAFVDIGVHQDGLVHISQLSDRFVKDPREVVSPGDRVTIKVLEVNFEKNQLSLTMKGTSSKQTAARDFRERDRTRGPRREKAAAKTQPNPQPREPRGPKPSGQPSPVQAVQPHSAGRVPHIRGARPKSEHASGPRRTPEPKPLFSNAFAGLASLKSSLPKDRK